MTSPAGGRSLCIDARRVQFVHEVCHRAISFDIGSRVGPPGTCAAISAPTNITFGRLCLVAMVVCEREATPALYCPGDEGWGLKGGKGCRRGGRGGWGVGGRRAGPSVRTVHVRMVLGASTVRACACARARTLWQLCRVEMRVGVVRGGRGRGCGGGVGWGAWAPWAAAAARLWRLALCARVCCVFVRGRAGCEWVRALGASDVYLYIGCNNIWYFLICETSYIIIYITQINLN